MYETDGGVSIAVSIGWVIFLILLIVAGVGIFFFTDYDSSIWTNKTGWASGLLGVGAVGLISFGMGFVAGKGQGFVSGLLT